MFMWTTVILHLVLERVSPVKFLPVRLITVVTPGTRANKKLELTMNSKQGLSCWGHPNSRKNDLGVTRPFSELSEEF